MAAVPTGDGRGDRARTPMDRLLPRAAGSRLCPPRRLMPAWLLAAGAALAQGVPQGQVADTPVAPVRPVTDTYFGVEVVDPYRWMEDGGPELLDYMRAENDLTRQTLAPFAVRDAQFLDELRQLADSVPLISGVQRVLDRYFYLETPPGKNDARLMMREVAGGEGRLLLDPATLAVEGKHAAIDYFRPSPDGRYVAVGVSLGGSENSVLRVVEVPGARLLGESISRTQEGAPSWTDDSHEFYFSRLQPMPAGAPAAAKYENMRVYRHLVGTDESRDVPMFGPDITRDPVLPRYGEVAVRVIHGTRPLLGSQVTGVVETPAYWIRRRAQGPWVQVIRHEDEALDIVAHGSRLYVLTKSGGGAGPGNGRVLSFDLERGDFSHARLELPESSLVLSAVRGTGVLAAQDAAYIYGFRDGLAVLTRLPYGHGSRPEELRLPIVGSIGMIDAERRRPGLTLMMQGWTVSRLVYAFDPHRVRFADTGLQPRSPVDMAAIAAEEVAVPTPDGTTVPLSILHRRDLPLDGSHPTLLTAYGA